MSETNPYAAPAAPTLTSGASLASRLVMPLWCLLALQMASPNQLGQAFLEYFDSETLSRFALLFSAATLLAGLWAFESDRAARAGRGRWRQIAAGSGAAVLLWAVAPSLATGARSALIVSSLLLIALSVASIAVFGVLAEITRERAATGWIAVLILGLTNLGLYPANAVSATIEEQRPSWAAGFGLVLALSVFLPALALVWRRRPAPEPEASGEATPDAGRPPRLAGVFVIAAVASLPALLQQAYLARPLIIPPPILSTPSLQRLFYSSAWVLVGVLYVFVCRRLSPALLARLGLGALAVVVLMTLAPRPAYLRFVLTAFLMEAALALGQYAILDLVLRTVRRGHEALGYWLLAMVASSLGRLLFVMRSLASDTSEHTWHKLTLAALLACAIAAPRLLGLAREEEAGEAEG